MSREIREITVGLKDELVKIPVGSKIINVSTLTSGRVSIAILYERGEVKKEINVKIKFVSKFDDIPDNMSLVGAAPFWPVYYLFRED